MSKPTPDSASLLIDPAALETIRQLQPPTGQDLLTQIFNIYLEETPQQLETLSEAVTKHDATLIFHITHSMKSSSANIGATELTKLCAILENNARKNNLETVEDELSTLSAMANQVLNEIKQHWLKNIR